LPLLSLTIFVIAGKSRYISHDPPGSLSASCLATNSTTA